MKGWNRVKECALCGESRCMVSSQNENLGYCFRFGKTFYRNPKDGRLIYRGSDQKKGKPSSPGLFDNVGSGFITAISQGDM